MNKYRPKKRFGQHFLVDQSVLMQIVQSIGLSQHDHCIEIGPGKGALTQYLLATSAKIHAIEIDQRFKGMLEEWAEKNPHFSFTLGDVLDVGINNLVPKSEQSYVVGNLPYEISTPLLFKLIPDRSSIKKMVFLLQKEVVDRITANVNTPEYGRLSVMMQYYFDVEALCVVPPEAFSPPPKVVSQVVQLIPIEREWADPAEFEAFVKHLFAQKRKMLRQRFKVQMVPQDWANVGIEPTSRPQDIELKRVIQLYEYLNQKGIRWC